MLNPHGIKSSVPDSIKKRKFIYSGVCPRSTLLRMLGYGLRVGVMVGIIGYFAGLLIKWIFVAGLYLAAFLGGISGLFGLAAIIFVYIGIGVVSLGYPAILGFSIGNAIDGQTVKGKCRNPKLARFTGFLCAIIGYVIFSLLAIQFTGYPQLTSRVFVQSSSLPGWFYILIFLDALIVIGTSASFSAQSIAKKQFCEIDDVWYKSSVYKKVRVDALESIFATLSSGSTDPMKNADLSLLNLDPPFLQLITSKCPNCESSDINISGELIWLDKQNKNGKTVTKKRNLSIFSTMTSFELGREIEILLTPKEAKPEEA